MVYDIKSKETKRTLRKLEEKNQTIFIIINGTKGEKVRYLSPGFLMNNKPTEVYLNNNKSINYNTTSNLILDKDGENVVEVVWNRKFFSLSSMFLACRSIVSLDLSQLDTSNARSMDKMFGICDSLTSLDLSSFNTSKVESLSNMFESCYSLESINLENFNTSNVKEMNKLFYNCTSLKSLDLSHLDTSNVNEMNYMFINCSSLKSLDLSSFNTSNVESMNSLF